MVTAAMVERQVLGRGLGLPSGRAPSGGCIRRRRVYDLTLLLHSSEETNMSSNNGKQADNDPGEAWHRRYSLGIEDNEDTLWAQLSRLRYTMPNLWDYIEDDWMPGAGYPPLVLFGASDQTCEGKCALAHVVWDGDITARTPDDVRLLVDVTADTELTTLAPAIGRFSFKPVPGLREWATGDGGSDKMTWDRYCFHRIDYDQCGRDVVEFEKKIGNDLLQCAGTKWETLARDRRWDWLKEAHERRDKLRTGQTPKKVKKENW